MKTSKTLWKRLTAWACAFVLAVTLLPAGIPAEAAGQSGIMTSSGITFSVNGAIMNDGSIKTWNNAGKMKTIAGNFKAIGGFSYVLLLEENGRVTAQSNFGQELGFSENIYDSTTDEEENGRKTAKDLGAGTILYKDGSYFPWSEMSLHSDYEGAGTDNKQVYGTYFVKNDGSLYVWDSSIGIYGGPRKIMDGVAYTTAGLAIKTDGTLWSWDSSNQYGEVGNGTVGVETPNPVKIMDNVVGAWSSGALNVRFALTANGDLYSWGANLNHSLGYAGGNATADHVNGRTSNCQSVPKKVDIDNVVAVYNNSSTTMALKRDGSLWVCGYVQGLPNGTALTGSSGFADTFVKFMDGVKLPAGIPSTSGSSGGTTPVQPTTPTQPETPTTPETPATPAEVSHVTGSVDMPQLSKQEIIDLLKKNPADMPSNVFEATPNCSAPYQAGKLTDTVLQAALNRLNALRRIAGMPAVTLDKSWCETAQHGAVICGALGQSTHTPSQPADMDKDFFDKAYEGASTSSLYPARDLLSAVDGWMFDPGVKNMTVLGHRSWQLTPTLDRVGFGYVNNGKSSQEYCAEKVVGGTRRSVDYDSYGWPTAGYFPNDMDFFGTSAVWSVCLNPNTYAAPSGVTVKISGGGKNWTLSGSYAPANSGKFLTVAAASGGGYKNNHSIFFRPDNVDKYEGEYTVTIEGLKHKDGSAVPFSYTVDFFSVNPAAPVTPPATTTETAPPPAPEATTKPTTPTTTTKPTTPTTPTTTPSTKTNPFTDVRTGAYYYDAVLWALEKDITKGVTATQFQPSASCTRGQVVTFLWRAKGCPEPKTTKNPFTDVAANSAFYKAILWAYENGITSGTTATTFNPRGTCTSAHVVTFLWRANGKPAASGSSPLAGSGKYYTDAVNWADSAGLLSGVGGTFHPNDISPRANIVTYLYRDMGK